MTTYSFRVILAGVDVLTPEMGRLIEQAGCNDSTMSSRGGVVSVAFDREARSLADAVGSAIQDIESAGCRVGRIEIEP